MTQNNLLHLTFNELNYNEKLETLNLLASNRGLKLVREEIKFNTEAQAMARHNRAIVFQDCIEQCANISRADSDFLKTVFQLLQYHSCEEKLDNEEKSDSIQLLFNFEPEEVLV